MDDKSDCLRREWIELAPRWIEEARAGGDLSRRALLDNYMLAACGDVSGLRILDCGCGEGRFSRMLLARGAQYVLGVDSCELMVEAARELQTGRDEYILADAQDLSFLADDSFDLAVSYLNQCDLPDFDSNVRELYRVLKAGGRLVVTNVHPMRSAGNGWHRAPDGTKLHVILDHYFSEGERRFTMGGVQITNFHRTLSTYVRSFLRAGFVLEDLIEPMATLEAVAEYPDIADERRVPNFIIFVLKK
ncbi:MAG TPA: class I SAM-dependent methyltransferase [Firmicutes bacterium]|nr:class I SAM-dependent methyltransferase [Bacillota bacterium]